MHAGFQINNDRHNVSIHEFAHLFDKEDGLIDGIPPAFQDKVYTLPWMQLIKTKTEEITDGENNINPYATYDRNEFFAVTSEYFFESPHLLKQKHPELYATLAKVFNQVLASIEPRAFIKQEIDRNNPCPCGSGKKYKHCCLN